MKASKFLLQLFAILFLTTCVQKDKVPLKEKLQKPIEAAQIFLPLDKGFSEYITGYTSGIIPANSVIEIRFTPEFAERANKQTPMGLFMFDPAIKGKTEWDRRNNSCF